jgi:RecA/RadA recombinase
VSKTAEEIKDKLSERKPKKEESTKAVSTGLDVLDLALTGKLGMGFLPGAIYVMPGDSQSGKSFLLRQAEAELVMNLDFYDYRIIDDNPERGTRMDLKKFFGQQTGGLLEKRLEKPHSHGDSRSIEEYYRSIRRLAKEGKPFFSGLDSEDALPSESSKALEIDPKTGKPKGSYNTEKARANSSGLREANVFIEPTDSIICIIKQTRQNIGYGAIFNPKIRSGGLALSFYATNELWFSIHSSIKKVVANEKEVQGHILQVTVKKNRVSGRSPTVKFPFYPSFGFDNTGANVNFLVDRGYWKPTREKKSDDKKTPKSIIADEFDFTGSSEKLILKIGQENKEQELRLLVKDVWQEIEEQLAIERKPRYV